MNREAADFGRGSYVGDIQAEDSDFFALPVRDQARFVGWADGCPVVTELTDPENQNPGRGPENMLDRYGEVNFWFGQIAREVDAVNHDLFVLLMTPVIREGYEPMGKHKPESVPVTHDILITPMGTQAGYALPRMFVEQLRSSEGTAQEVAGRCTRGMEVVQAAALSAQTPAELMAGVAEGLAHADADPMRLLGHMLGQGWLDEHNAQGMFSEGKAELSRFAPDLWALYCSLTPEQLLEQKLA